MHIPQKIVEVVVRKFPNPEDAEKILRELKYDTLNNVYYFYHAGMYHGIEEDGYIHT